MNLKLFFFLFIGLFVACNGGDDDLPCEDTPCPENQDGGNIPLDKDSEDFLPLNGLERLVFLSESGESLTFNSTQGFETEVNPISFTNCEQACTSSRIDYTSDILNLSYIAGEHRISYAYRVTLAGTQANGDAAFVDVLEITSFDSQNGGGSMKILTSYRDNPEDAINDASLSTYTEVIPVLDLFGKEFGNVFTFISGDRKLYLNRGFGLVGFQNSSSGGLWRLERIE